MVYAVSTQKTETSFVGLICLKQCCLSRLDVQEAGCELRFDGRLAGGEHSTFEASVRLLKINSANCE
jgi:hypothetical protein